MDWSPTRRGGTSNTARVPDAVTALEDPLALTIPDRAPGEERFVTIGLAAEGALLVVAWSPHGTGGRILSARRATRRERHRYEEEP